MRANGSYGHPESGQSPAYQGIPRRTSSAPAFSTTHSRSAGCEVRHVSTFHRARSPRGRYEDSSTALPSSIAPTSATAIIAQTIVRVEKS